MKIWRLIAALSATLLFAGCAASIASTALELAGIRKPPELPEIQKPPRMVAIRLHASANLNAGNDGQPLALAARIYKLRQASAFEHAAYQGFLNSHTERELLGDDLLDVREVQLIPGQRYEVTEKVGREASFIGVVALFRNPAPQRWRLAFAVQEAEQSGITIGLHACALSVGAGASSADGRPLAGARCQP
jgi:type VI secretion system protein VasD